MKRYNYDHEAEVKKLKEQNRAMLEILKKTVRYAESRPAFIMELMLQNETKDLIEKIEGEQNVNK